MPFLGEAGRLLAGWCAPAVPDDAEEDVAPLYVRVDVLLCPSSRWTAVLPAEHFDLPAVAADRNVELLREAVHRVPFVL